MLRRSKRRKKRVVIPTKAHIDEVGVELSVRKKRRAYSLLAVILPQGPKC